MKWITRERPKIDRIACPWLIARFIDSSPEFPYVPGENVLRIAAETGAIPYDVAGVELTHVNELRSFDAFLKKYQLAEPALQKLAVIIRGGRYLAAESDTAICRPVRNISRPVAQVSGWPCHAAAWHGHVRCAVCLVPKQPDSIKQ